MESTSISTKKIDPKLWFIVGIVSIFFCTIYFTRAFYYDIFSIPGASMEPTINVGNYVIINKSAYNKTATTSDVSTQPKHGEIFAFQSPYDKNTILLKRIIGTPGDTISFSDKHLTVNEQAIETKKLDASSYSENLNSHIYSVQYQNEQNPYRTFTVVVPENHYFVMGDNRDNSADSRMWGFVPSENIVGKLVASW